MERRTLFAILGLSGLVVAAALLLRQSAVTGNRPKHLSVAQQTVPSQQQSPILPVQVPAHYAMAPGISSLGTTLAPEKFTGETRAAYQAVKELPQTIAQMPCYCYCDRGMGHKSLHSCFEDDHAAHCAVCTGEALMAYKLQKQGLTPTQIRDRIIAEYSQQ